jgi:hypothetical protein
LSADKDLVIVSDIDVGTGSVILSSTNDLVLGGAITATNLDVSSGGDLTMTSQVESMDLDITGAGSSVTVFQTGNLNVGTLNMNGGSINFVMLSGDLNIDEIGGVAGEVIITVKDGDVNIKNNDTGDVTIIAEDGAVDVSLEADTLSIIANGDINIVEADDVIISEIVQIKPVDRLPSMPVAMSPCLNPLT